MHFMDSIVKCINRMNSQSNNCYLNEMYEKNQNKRTTHNSANISSLKCIILQNKIMIKVQNILGKTFFYRIKNVLASSIHIFIVYIKVK